MKDPINNEATEHPRVVFDERWCLLRMQAIVWGTYVKINDRIGEYGHAVRCVASDVQNQPCFSRVPNLVCRVCVIYIPRFLPVLQRL